MMELVGRLQLRLCRLQTRGVTKPMSNQKDANGGNGGETPDSAAQYIAALSRELALMARRNGLDTLSYILEMAQIEADQIAKD
ncbi:MAG TPA: hypothetical protein VHX43_11360 [Xanthobacteraceae bacterium]|jgi:hypothetical protein|nr:hypothetical protein [Xanthobacteraceae bacterium]